MFSVIIPMAGKGTRVNKDKNKALLEINGKPMFLYAYETFKKYDCEIILVISPDDYDEIKEYINDDFIYAFGGNTRAESVYNGLKLCKNEYVLIHDAARPFISEKIIDNVLKELDNNAVLVTAKAKDTVRDNGKVLVRDNLTLAQTPQACKVNDLKEAYNKAFMNNDNITDDISVIEKYTNLDIKYVDGDDYNFKVTTPLDLKLALIIAKEKIHD